MTALVDVPAAAYLGGWILGHVLVVFLAAGTGGVSGVALCAHIGGFLVGAFLASLFGNRLARVPRKDGA